MMVATLVMSILAVILSALTCGFSIYAFARVMALEKSTHKVQMVPVGEAVVPTDKEEAAEKKKRPTVVGAADIRPENYPNY